MNPWLVTWEAAGPRAEGTIKNRIAAILPKLLGMRQVGRILEFLYANYLAHSGSSDSVFVSEQMRYATARHPYKATHASPPFMVLTCGANPHLRARQVFDLVVSETDGVESVRWEEAVNPVLNPKKDLWEQIQARQPFKRRVFVYDTATNRIFIQSEMDGPPLGVPRRRARKGR